jgi:hypothetical protein
MVMSLEARAEKLLSRTEAMVLLCSKASTYWSMIKFGFNIPLVLTSSAMLIINSISEDANVVKIPNIVVNAISVLIMSLNNSIKASEKCDLFRRLGQQFLLLRWQRGVSWQLGSKRRSCMRMGECSQSSRALRAARSASSLRRDALPAAGGEAGLFADGPGAGRGGTRGNAYRAAYLCRQWMKHGLLAA